MEKLIVKTNGKVEDAIYGYTDINGVFYAKDAYNNTITLHNWAEAMNYLNTEGGRTLGNGFCYYNTWKETGRLKDIISNEFVAEQCNGTIEIVEED